MSQENDHDFRDQHKILVLEMLTNPCGGLVTKILLHSVICNWQIILLFNLLRTFPHVYVSMFENNAKNFLKNWHNTVQQNFGDHLPPWVC